MVMRDARWCVSALAISLAGCLRPDLTACGALACPAEKVCDAIHQLCVSPAQLTACGDSPDGTACQASSLTGICYDKVCLAPGCGNHVVEPALGELCDPPGPMCSADCRSNLICGNGVVDSELGEQCDDGNLRNHDGCDSRCQIETLMFKPIPFHPRPANPFAGAMDQARSVFVQYDGLYTWEWNGTAWTRIAGGGPTGQVQTFYAPDLGRVALIVETDTTKRTFQWWDWNGVTWTEHDVANQGPSAVGTVYISRAYGYDEVAHRVIEIAIDGTTWLLDLGAGMWTMTTASPVLPSPGSPIVFDRVRKVDVAVTVDMGILEWSGTAWAATSVVGAQPPWNVVYDDDLGKVLLSGSGEDVYCDGCSNYFVGSNASSTWDGASLLALATTGTAPPACGNAGNGYEGTELGFDPANHRLEFIPGLCGDTATGAFFGANGDVWTLSGTTWLGPSHVTPPNGSALPVTVGRGRVFVEDGFDASTAAGIWTLTDHWAPPTIATPIAGFTVYDPVRDHVLVVPAQANAAVIELQDTAWSTLGAAVPEAPNAVGYDFAGRRIVMLGPTHTWALDSTGTTWTAIAPPIAVGFGGSYEPSLACDATTSTMVARTSVGLFELDNGAWITAAGPTSGAFTYSTWSTRGGVIAIPVGSVRNAAIWERHGADIVRGATLPFAFDGVVVDAPQLGGVMGIGQVDSFFGTFVIGYFGTGGEETCDGVHDGDGDGLVGCADPDCWWSCTPACPPGVSCM